VVIQNVVKMYWLFQFLQFQPVETYVIILDLIIKNLF
jgi:hypothetical protein